MSGHGYPIFNFARMEIQTRLTIDSQGQVRHIWRRQVEIIKKASERNG